VNQRSQQMLPLQGRSAQIQERTITLKSRKRSWWECEPRGTHRVRRQVRDFPCPAEKNPKGSGDQPKRHAGSEDHLRWRIRDRILRFLRPIFRRPLPVFFVPTANNSHHLCISPNPMGSAEIEPRSL